MKVVIKDALKDLYDSLSEDTFDLLDFQNKIWEIEELAHDVDLYIPFANIWTMSDAADLGDDADPYVYEYIGNIETDLYTSDGKERFIDVTEHLDIKEIFYDDIVTRLGLVIDEIAYNPEKLIDET